jgi:hypothetical protein
MKLLLSSIAAIAFAGAAFAADVSTEIGADVTKNIAGDYIVTPSVDLSFGSKTEGATAFGSLGVVSDNGDLAVDTWALGLAFGATSVSLGDQEDLFSFGGLEVVGGDTLATVADDHESIIVKHGSIAGLIGFTDIGADVSEIENVQLSYAKDYGKIDVTSALDYNLDTEDTTVAVSTGVEVTEAVYANMTVTYADAFAYEALGAYTLNEAVKVSAFVNGDEDEFAQNVGAGVVYTKDSLSAYAEVGYNIDAEEVTPAVGISFSF